MDVKTYYWSRVRNLTVIWLVFWTIIAIVLPVMSPLWKGVKIAGLPSMHWYMNAMVVIWIGVALIFIYAFIMNRLDAELRKKVTLTEEELI